jgi:soluble lytic murein transglycosylase-like protein
MTNACGGLGWQMRPDGLVEVDGEGTPAFDPSSVQFLYLEQSWANWSSLILDGANTNGIPPQWILAIICQETGPWSGNPDEQASKISFDGGVGLMQITDPSLGDPHDMLDPATNVAVGSAFLGRLSRAHDGELPEVAAGYNVGSVRWGSTSNPWGMVMTGDYVGNVIKWNNTALMYLNLGRSHVVLGLSLAAAGLYIGALVVGLLPVPRPVARLL